MIDPNRHSYSWAQSCPHFLDLWRSTVHVSAVNELLTKCWLLNKCKKTNKNSPLWWGYLHAPVQTVHSANEFAWCRLLVQKGIQSTADGGRTLAEREFSIQPAAWLTAALSSVAPKQHIGENLTTMISKTRQKNPHRCQYKLLMIMWLCQWSWWQPTATCSMPTELHIASASSLASHQ